MIFVLWTYGAIYCWTAFFCCTNCTRRSASKCQKKCWSKFPKIIDPSTILIHKLIYQFTSAGSFLEKKPAKKCVITKNSYVHYQTAKAELNWSISVGISTCDWPSVILKYWNAQGHTGSLCSLHSVHCRNSSLHLHPTQGAGADTVWECVCVLPLWGRQGIQTHIH